MLPNTEQLELLAATYVRYLIERDESILKKHLSLDFQTRRRVTNQVKMITRLPRLIHGTEWEIHLFKNYHMTKGEKGIVIKPFQFEVLYCPYINIIDPEKITITLHEVALENDEWKISSIISKEEGNLLERLLNRDETVGYL